jgi:hypothetical protein
VTFVTSPFFELFLADRHVPCPLARVHGVADALTLLENAKDGRDAEESWVC